MKAARMACCRVLMTTSRKPCAVQAAKPPSEGRLAQFSGQPRSVIWSGGAIHLRTVGKNCAPPSLHSHFAVQLTAGIRRRVSFNSSSSGVTRFSGGWLVGSDQPHRISGNGPIATIFLDPLSPMGRRAAALIGSAGARTLAASHCEVACRVLEECWSRGWRSDDLQRAVERIVDLIAPAGTPIPAMDSRVRSVVDELLKHSNENTRMQDLAAGVGLSESRLAHLFRSEVGIPMRQYRLTLRMGNAVRWIARGHSLTESAHLAGFADSSQFCRICRRMVGSAPSALPEFDDESMSG